MDCFVDSYKSFDHLQMKTAALYVNTEVFGFDLDMMMIGTATMNSVNVMIRVVKMYSLSANSVESFLAFHD